MKLYSLEGGSNQPKKWKDNSPKLKQINSIDFELEDHVKWLIENNTKEIFGLDFVRTEFWITSLTGHKFRIDSLCFNPETNSFVIVEYKKVKKYSVIDQGYTYLKIMLQRQSDFVLEYNNLTNNNLKVTDINWNYSRVIFVLPKYTDYQLNSISQHVPFRLFEIKKYSNNTISLLEHVSLLDYDFNELKKNKVSNTKGSGLINDVHNVVEVYTEDYHRKIRKNIHESVLELYEEIKERVLSLGDSIEVRPLKKYIGFISKTNFIDIEFQTKNLLIHINLKKGELEDSKNLTKDVSTIGHYGNGDYEIRVFPNKTDLDYLMILIKQSFKKHKN